MKEKFENKWEIWELRAHATGHVLVISSTLYPSSPNSQHLFKTPLPVTCACSSCTSPHLVTPPTPTTPVHTSHTSPHLSILLQEGQPSQQHHAAQHRHAQLDVLC